MRVILTDDVDRLGRKGDVVDVAAGYARNYLVPRALAVPATEGATRQAESMRRAREEAEKRHRQEADELAQQLAGSRIVVAARAGDEGRLFGSVNAGDVAEAILKFTGVDVDKRLIDIPDPIKEIGLHEVAVHPHPDVVVPISLDVIPT